jgi:heptosyltransferase-3
MTAGDPTLPSVRGGSLSLRRILVVQTQRMGDVLCATPVFTALRNRFPEAHLAALVHRPHDVILQANPDLNEVLSYDRLTTHRSLLSRLRFVKELRQRQFDWALVIHAASSVAFALSQSGIPWRTCVWRYGDRLKPHWARTYHQQIRQDRESGRQHEVEHNLDVLRELGIEPQHSGCRVQATLEEDARAAASLAERGRDEAYPLAIIHPGHGGGRQEWAPEQYAAVGDGLRARGFQVAISGSDRETELVKRVVGAMRPAEGPPPVPLAPGTGLRTLIGVISRATLFVSVSTGPMHLAAALQVPSVTLHGPDDLADHITRFCTYNCPHHTVRSPVACVCAASKTCENAVCMAAITPDLVLRAADDLLSGIRSG